MRAQQRQVRDDVRVAAVFDAHAGQQPLPLPHDGMAEQPPRLRGTMDTHAAIYTEDNQGSGCVQGLGNAQGSQKARRWAKGGGHQAGVECAPPGVGIPMCLPRC